MARKKINPMMKQIDAAARLALGGKKDGQVVVSGGMLYSMGLDTCATSALPDGVYQGAQLLAAFEDFKYATDINIEGDNSTGAWKVVLSDGNGRTHLDYRQCEQEPVAGPSATWTVAADQRKHIKLVYSLATKLETKQIRYVELRSNGMMRFTSPMAVMDWYYSENDGHGDTIAVAASDLKRASLYRGGKLEGISAGQGKVNFIYSDGAWLRVNTYDGDYWGDDQIDGKFEVGGMGFILSDATGLALDTLLSGKKRTFLWELPMLVNTAPYGGISSPLYTIVSECANEIAFCDGSVPWRDNRVVFTGPLYRALLVAALSEAEAQEYELL